MKNTVLILFMFLVGCSSWHKPLQAPGRTAPPPASTTNLNEQINTLDTALRNATTRTDRIRLLVDALSFKDVITPEKR